MLKSLSITNFALIENAVIEFSSGLNILTGETGAGKSIMVDALGIVLGNRASAEAIRTGCEFFKVEATFDITKQAELLQYLEEQAIEVAIDELLIISRRFTRQGKNNIMIHGTNVPLAVLRQVGEKLVDMHGQHENQTLLRPETHLAELDCYNLDIQKVLCEYNIFYREWLNIKQQLKNLMQDSWARVQRQDTLAWQVDEIAAAALTEGEDLKLEQELKVLANAEKIARAVNRVCSLFNAEAVDGSGALTVLGKAKREIETAVRFMPQLDQYVEVINNILYQLEDVSGDLARTAAELEYRPDQIASLQERLEAIYKLKKKYGQTIQDVLEYYAQARDELTELIDYEDNLHKTTASLAEIEKKVDAKADEIDNLRRKTAADLSSKVSRQLADLAMPQANFRVELTALEEFLPTGRNKAVFLFSANPGEELKLLHKVASGGELSRIALALKAICVNQEAVGTMVFDEVDSGVDGQTAMAVAEKIAFVSRGKQVLCITHLPQIACMADWHLYIEKVTDGVKTLTTLRTLSEEERLIELTRMISGNNISKIAIDNAAQILELARKTKEKWK